MIKKLYDAIENKNAPIVVGLDPNLKFVPESIKEKAYKEKGETLEGAAKAIWKFNKKLIDNIYDLIPAVKPQSAMYEQYGLPGLKAYKKTIDYCHEKGLIVIGDIKRGDIGSTSEAYAAGHIGKVAVGSSSYMPFNEDMATVNPYLGSDGVLPFIKVCKENDRGIFVLVKTSNPSSGEFQDRIIDGKPLYEHVAGKVEEWGSDNLEGNYSNVGAVVGATYPEQGETLRKLMPHTFILVPGYGAQGATGKDLAGFFDDNKNGAIVNSSRGIIAAHTKEPYKDRYGEDAFADAARAAVLDMIKDINGSIGR
ncbi:MAG: orotidine-5'-phosphate decarboxylase [Lachnospiraceae bacterium]|nr:orotidine-5'-phosphate decarboxylase [Lachnospiraceae bacterium]